MPEIRINDHKILYNQDGPRVTFWGKSLPEKSYFIVEENRKIRFHYPHPPSRHFIDTIQPKLEEFFQSLYNF